MRVNSRDSNGGADADFITLTSANLTALTIDKTPKVFISNTIKIIKIPLLKITYCIITFLISLYLTLYKIFIWKICMIIKKLLLKMVIHI